MGIKKSFAWPFLSVTLKTTTGDYTLQFASPKCISTFIRYVEKQRSLLGV